MRRVPSLAAGKSKLNPAKLMDKYMNRVLASMAAGVATKIQAYNRGLLKHGAKHCIWDVKEREYYAVK